VSATGRAVDIRASIGLRDFSGNWDDLYRGRLFFDHLIFDDSPVRIDTGRIQVRRPELPPSTESGNPASGSFQLPPLATHPIGVVGINSFQIAFTNGDSWLRRLTFAVSIDGNVVGTRLGAGTEGHWWKAHEGHAGFTALRFPSNSIVHYDNWIFSSGQYTGPITEQVGGLFDGVRLMADRVSLITRGFNFEFFNGDHPVRQLVSIPRLNAVVPAQDPTSNTTLLAYEHTGGIRDDSGSWDDPYGVTSHFAMVGFTNV
jgi:hypothetical protein